MRPSLVVSGFFLIILGLLLYVTEIPFGFSWSLPMMGGGLVFAAAGALLKETQGRVEPPEGHRFCVFCHTPVKVGERRCGYCNGLQPPE